MKGNLNKEEFYKNNISKLAGALFLIIPGFFTDILGILFFSGILNFIFIKVINNKFNKTQTKNSNTHNGSFFYTNNSQNNANHKKNVDNNIIDVEIIEPLENKKNKSNKNSY
jgi:2-isopropylmalate synthase/UPF0716 protein FxsA